MTNGGDAAEMLVRLYLEGFEEVVKLSGKGIKELVPLLASTLKQKSKSKGKARLTQMIKSGSSLKVFTFKNKDSRIVLIPESLGGTSVHNGLMKNSGFIGSYTHFSLAHL